jgi:hypothetical protein
MEDYSFSNELEVPFRINFITLAEQTDGTVYWLFMQGTSATAWGYLQNRDTASLVPAHVARTTEAVSARDRSSPSATSTDAVTYPSKYPRCTHPDLFTCIDACNFPQCVQVCVDVCGTPDQKQLYRTVNPPVLTTVSDPIQPSPDTLPKGAMFYFYPPQNNFPRGSGGDMSTISATEYFGEVQGNTIEISIPTAGCPAFNFLDFENPCGTISFSNGGDSFSLRYTHLLVLPPPVPSLPLFGECLTNTPFFTCI